MQFSANLGFLWKELCLPDAIRAAKAAGFHAVECHFPYDTPAAEVKAALEETGLKMLGLNTIPGDVAGGEFGLCALPGREVDARAAIDKAVSYAAEIGAGAIHVMAGKAKGVEAQKMFVSKLRYACKQAAPHGITILIEPLNTYDVPGYFMTTTDHAEQIIELVDEPNIKLMFDCYHMQLMQGDLSHAIERLLPKIGHIQFASVPDRGAPDHGEVSYAHIFKVIEGLGYKAPVGAEYKPTGSTEETLGWLQDYL